MLPQEKLDEMDEQVMTDDDFYNHLLLIEDELVDQYLDDELTAEEARRFESHFLCSRERRQKLRFGRTLREYVALQTVPAIDSDQASEQTPVPVPVKPESRWQSFLGAIGIHHPAWGYGLAALLILNISGGFWGLMKYSALKSEVGGVQTEQRAALEHNRELRDRTDRLSQDVQRLESEREGLRKEVEALRAGSPPPRPAPGSDSHVLTSGFTRSSGTMTRITIPESKMAIVNIILDMETNDYDVYEVRLLMEGEEIMKSTGLEAVEDPDKIRLAFPIPAASLEPADYELRLFGIHNQGVEEYVLTYHFRARNP
jgi:hypothetical protein